MPEGFLAIDKGQGWTSHDVVAKVRGLLDERRVGHAGTLDPGATGLLMLAVGRSTRLLRFVQDMAKEYVARVVFGVATDTLDAEGAVLWREPMRFGPGELEAVLPRFVGRIMQMPPMVSAVRVQGERLHRLARRGLEVERARRPVDVHRIEMLDFAPGDYPEATLRVICGKGTYVRSLADDIGRALGGRAHLGRLRRTGIGSFSADEDGRTIASLEALAGRGSLERVVLPPAEGLRDLPAVTVSTETARAAGNGMVFAAGSLGDQSEGPLRILDEAGDLLAVYRRRGAKLAPEVVLK